jgi:hypothetical protein
MHAEISEDQAKLISRQLAGKPLELDLGERVQTFGVLERCAPT